MPSPIPPEVAALIGAYQKAQERLIKILADAQARGNVTSYRRAIMNQVNAELALLDKLSAKWATAYIPKVYAESVRKLYAFYKKAGLEMPEIAINRRAISMIVENTLGLLTDASKHLGRIWDDAIRQAGVDATAEKLAAGDTVKQMKKNLTGKLMDQGLTSILYRNGQRVRLDAYAELVARSTTRETANRAVMQQMKDLGEDLVQISNHRSACPVCASYEGRVYSLTGRDKRYPHIEQAFKPPYANIHPNCSHVLTPYIEKFDDDAAATREYSNRPFNVDDRAQAEIDAYYEAQAKKAQIRRDRKAYDEMRFLLGSDAPTTFAAYMAKKRVNNESFARMQLDYRRRKLRLNKPEVALPHSDKAYYEDQKFTRYIFNPENPHGYAKGVAFSSHLGYNANNYKDMGHEILSKTALYPAYFSRTSEFGDVYNQYMILYGPNRNPMGVRVVWEIRDEKPRLVTVHPNDKKIGDPDD